MKKIETVETNYSGVIIGKLKELNILKSFGFQGGYLYLDIKNKDYNKALTIINADIKTLKGWL